MKFFFLTTENLCYIVWINTLGDVEHLITKVCQVVVALAALSRAIYQFYPDLKKVFQKIKSIVKNVKRNRIKKITTKGKGRL